MLMRDDLGLLLLGAREAIYAVDINDISVKKAAVRISDTLTLLRNNRNCIFFFCYQVSITFCLFKQLGVKKSFLCQG